MARWLATDPKVLLLNDPTRGIDLGAKRDLYALLLELAADGLAVVMLSTEVDEHVELMDRVARVPRGTRCSARSRATGCRATRWSRRSSAGGPRRSPLMPDVRELLRTRRVHVRAAAGGRAADRQRDRAAELRRSGQLAGAAGDAGAVRAGRDGVDAVDRVRRRRAGHQRRPADDRGQHDPRVLVPAARRPGLARGSRSRCCSASARRSARSTACSSPSSAFSR